MRTIAQEELLAAHTNDSHLYEWLLSEALGLRRSSPRPVPRQTDVLTLSAPHSGAASRTAWPEAADVLVAGATGTVSNLPPAEQMHVTSVEFRQMSAGPPPQPTSSLPVEGESPDGNQVPKPVETSYESVSDTSGDRVQMVNSPSVWVEGNATSSSKPEIVDGKVPSMPKIVDSASLPAKKELFSELLSLINLPAQQLITMVSTTVRDLNAASAFDGSSSAISNAAEQNIHDAHTEVSTTQVVSLPARMLEPPPSEQVVEEAVHVEFGRLVAGPPPTSQPRPSEPLPMPSTTTKTVEQALQQLERVRAAREAERQAGKAIPLQSGAAGEELITLQIGQPIAPSEFSLPAPTKVTTTQRRKLRWVTASETVVVQGVTIAGSQFFLGNPKRNAESYVVDPTLPIGEGLQHIGEESALTHRYNSFSPYVRFRYLRWLAGGARERVVPTGFAKLYFQNLERRLLEHLKQPADGSPEEIETLLAEVKRIDTLFLLTPNAVTYHSKCVLQFFEARAYVGAAMPPLPARSGRSDELPFDMRLGLGCFIKENQPIPANWALNWAYTEPTIFLRTAPWRCPEEFEAAFHYLYEERYGQGIVIKPNKTLLKIDYQPMWSGGDDSKVELTFTDVPDVKALTAPQSILSKLAADATDLIDRYSRTLGPTGKGAGTLEALLRLPSVLWTPQAKNKLGAFRSHFVEPMVPVTADALLAAVEGDGEVGSTRILELAKCLQAFGIGFEPDVLNGAHKPKASEFVVLFPLPERSMETIRVPAQAPLLAVTLAAVLAQADGHASNEEAAAADGLVERWPGLSLDDRARLSAVYRLNLRQPPTLTSFKSKLAALSKEDRKIVASALTTMAAADGVVSAEEVSLLERIYRMLELEAQTLYSDLHNVEGSQGPVVASSRATNLLLDPARLTRLRAQSSEVGALLAGVFAEEDGLSTPLPVTAPALFAENQERVSASEPRILSSLSAVDGDFLALLVTKPIWTRQELIASAAEFQIMLDGTLERINEAALDQLGDFLIEGDDPLYVQQTLLEATE